MRRREQALGVAGVLIACSIYSWPVLAQESLDLSLPISRRVEVSALTERSIYNVDDEIAYRLVIRWREQGADIKFAPPSLPLENLTLIGITQSAETRMEGDIPVYERVLAYRLRPIRSGRASIGRFVFEYGLAESTQPEKMEIAPAFFDIRPRPLWKTKAWPLAMAGGVSLLTVILGLLVYRRGREGKKAALEKELSLEDECLRQLDMLGALQDERRAKDYVTRSGEIFKQYLKQRYELSAANLGGLDLLEWIERRRDIDVHEKKQIRAILESWNESQFAGVPPGLEEARTLYKQISDFIGGKKVL